MDTKRIYSENADFQMLEVLKTNRNKRYKYNMFLVEGVRNINNAVKYGWKIRSCIYSYEMKLSDWAKNMIKTAAAETNCELPLRLMAKISGKENMSELLAVVNMKEDALETGGLPPNPVFVLFDRPSNKGNLGTIIRSCDAFDAGGLIVTGHAVDIYDPEVVRSSVGSFFKLPIIRISDNSRLELFISNLKSKFPGLKIIGTTAHGETNLFDVDLSGPVLFLVGNETDGLSRRLAEMSDVSAAIPMGAGSSASSLNVGCAASIMLCEAARRRKK